MPSSIDNSESKLFDDNQQMSRRDFLRAGATAILAATGLAMGLKPNEDVGENSRNLSKDIVENDTEGILNPEIIHGVPVYGRTEKINSLDQIENLYSQLDHKYEREHTGVQIGNKFEQRKELLNPNERYLEIVVFQSAFDSFEKRVEETGVDFVEWIQMHVDSTNLCISEAKPPGNLKVVLRRVLILQDGTLDSIFDMEKYLRGEASYGPDLPYNYNFVFSDKVPLDTDESWVVGGDYRKNTQENIDNDGLGCFWSCTTVNDKVYYQNPPGGKDKQKIRVYNNTTRNSLTNKKNVWLDFGMTHEWSHYLLNIPDEYGYDVLADQKLKLMNGNFQEPYLSAYLSVLLQNQIRKKLRDPHREGCGVGYKISEIPDSINITIKGDSQIVDAKILRTNENSEKFFSESPDLQAKNNIISTNKDILNQDNSYAIKVDLDVDGSKRNLYIPYLAFNMSHILNIKNPTYFLEILGDIKDSEIQYLIIVDKTHIDGKSEELKRINNLQPIARMKIEGSNAYYVWFQ